MRKAYSCLLMFSAIALLAFGETVELPDFPKFSAPRAITTGPHDHFFANYFAINAWSPDGRYALVLETDIKDKLPEGTPCTLGLVDLSDGNRFIPVTTTRCWNFQEAAMAHWMPCEKDTFVFNDIRDGKFCAVVMNWKTKKERTYPFPVSAVTENGEWAISINYARLYLTRPDYGYAGNGQDPQEGVVFPENDGLWRVNLLSGEAELIVPTSVVKDVVPSVGPTGMSYLCHTVISKDFTRIYFLSRSVSLLPTPREFHAIGKERECSLGKINRAVASFTADESLPAEGCRLTVSDSGISIYASDSAGAFYAGQTLRELMTDGRVQCCQVVDSPRFLWSRRRSPDSCESIVRKSTYD